MNRVKFSADWDKLKEPRFTTIRSYGRDKEVFYASHRGERFTLLRVPHEFAHHSKGRKIGEATLLSVSRVVPRELPLQVLLDDVRQNGRPSGEWLQKLGKMDEALLLTFENHTGLLGLGAKRGPPGTASDKGG
jgi:hypothetical protein